MFGWFKPLTPKRVEYVEVKPTDSFIVCTEHRLSNEEREQIARFVERFRSGEAKTLVLDAGFSITVVSQ
jgi:hypothetical protein